MVSKDQGIGGAILPVCGIVAVGYVITNTAQKTQVAVK